VFVSVIRVVASRELLALPAEGLTYVRLTTLTRRAAFAVGIFLATSGLLAACGGGGGDGSDEGYAKSICEANDVLDEVLGAAIAAAFSGDDDEDATDEVVAAFEKWLDALDDANPPSDVADYHNGLVDGISEAIDAMKNGDADFESAFDQIVEPEEPSQAIQDRIGAAATDVPACEGVELFS